MTRTASPYCERHVWDKAADADCPHHPRYEFNGHPSDGEEAVRELLHGFMHGTSDSHLEITRLRHMDDGVLVEGGYNGDPFGRSVAGEPGRRQVDVFAPVLEVASAFGDIDSYHLARVGMCIEQSW